MLYFLCLLVYSRLLVLHLILFHDRGTSAPPVFVSRFKYKKGTTVSFLYLGILCTAAWADVAECHLVNGLGEKYFINYQSVSWLANSKCASSEQAVRSRWCLSPVF